MALIFIPVSSLIIPVDNDGQIENRRTKRVRTILTHSLVNRSNGFVVIG
jgi:hypothetical protein